MPFVSNIPLPTDRVTFPLVSAPAPPALTLQAFGAGSSPVPYSQSGPGSLVSPVLMTSLSPTCGFDVLMTPKPHRYMSRREQRPPSRGTTKVGVGKAGGSQD